jgi:hypothetical protein
LFEVAVLQSDTGLCDACTQKQLETSRHTISTDEPTASFQIDAAMKCATTNLWNASSPKVRHVKIPLGYVDEHFIDEGGMGLVFRALEVSTGRTVAIKMLHARKMSDDMIARFSVEAKALASLCHQNVVLLYEFNERAKPPYLVMEYVDGTSAHAQLKAKTRFEIKEAVQVIHQASLGVHAAHLCNVIHRDIKPSNLLINQKGLVKLTDFGLAKRLNENDDLTIHGGIAGGTPGYMAPEQVNPNLGEIAAATDVWGLGATLYCLLAGTPPYPATKNDVLAVLMKDHKSVRTHRPEVSPVLEAIVQKCLTFEQADRYPSVEALASDLNNYLHNRPTVVRPPSWVGRLWHTARSLQTPTVVAWSLALLVLGIIGASFFTKQAERIAPQIIITDEVRLQEYFEDCRQKLRDGKPVMLIGDDGAGPPKHVVWPFITYPFSKPMGNNGAAHLVAGSHCVAELLDDPGIDRYILRGEFQQIGLGINNDNKPTVKTETVAEAGFALGRSRLKCTSGREIESFMTFAFQDGSKEQKEGQLKQATFTGRGIYFDTSKKDFNLVGTFNMGYLDFRPTVILPGLWRQLEVHVSPEEIMPRMGIKNEAMSNIVKPDGLPAPVRYLNEWRFHLKTDSTFPNDSAQDLAWNPRRPVGIWCQSSSVLLRNVEIIPVADKSKD